MSAKRRKSKKQSDANSEWQREELVLFLDRNLGKHVIAGKLRSAGMNVEVHDDHLPADAPDEAWIELVGQNGWVALTKDKNILYRAAEINSIKKYSARVIVVRAKETTGLEIAEMLVKRERKIVSLAKKTAAPFVAGIYRNGQVGRYDID